MESKGPWKISLQVDGREIELNRFCSSILTGTLLGMLSSLRGVENPGEIKMEIKKEE